VTFSKNLYESDKISNNNLWMILDTDCSKNVYSLFKK
jgi:hypothetical protein